MKLITLIILSIILSSCGPSKEKKAVCQSLDNIDKCTNKETIQTMAACLNDTLQNMKQELAGDNLKIPATDHEKIQTAILTYGTCSRSAVTQATSTSSLTGGNNLETPDMDKLKNAFKECLNKFLSEAKIILKCE